MVDEDAILARADSVERDAAERSNPGDPLKPFVVFSPGEVRELVAEIKRLRQFERRRAEWQRVAEETIAAANRVTIERDRAKAEVTSLREVQRRIVQAIGESDASAEVYERVRALAAPQKVTTKAGEFVLRVYDEAARARIEDFVLCLRNEDGTIEQPPGEGRERLVVDLSLLLSECDQSRKALARAAHLADNLFSMIDPSTWHRAGGDDGQGHYEGDYHAEQCAQEIHSLKEVAAGRATFVEQEG